MVLLPILSYAAAYFSLIIAAAVFLRDRRSLTHRVFAAGVFLLAMEELLLGFSYSAILPADITYWQKSAIAISALMAPVWLTFSVAYARANSSAVLSKWKWAITAGTGVAILFVAAFHDELFAGSVYQGDSARWSIPLGWAGRAVQFFFLLLSILVLFNLERTIRSSIGRIRWQIKFMALGVSILFAARIYWASQALLFSSLDTRFISINAAVLLTANLLFALSLSRGQSLNVDVYLSASTIQNSLTVVIVGVYLVVVGTMARLVGSYGADQSLPVDAFVVFLGLTSLAVLLLSNRLRRKLRLFVSRNFSRPAYDYRGVWMELTQRTTSIVDPHELSKAVSRMVSESLEFLSVSVWLVDESKRRLILAGSTALPSALTRELEEAGKSAPALIRFLEPRAGYVDFEEEKLAWPEEIMLAAPDFFGEFRIRYCVGLQASGELVGVMTLNDDRVGKQDLSAEDAVLLETLAAQLAARLQNLRLSDRVRYAKEVETFQTVSTFFVHDLKNLASRLSLTMQNLHVHFDDAEFRTDAMRVISNSISKIDDMCNRLALLKQNIELKLGPCDLNKLVGMTLAELKSNVRAEVVHESRSVPKALIDSEQIHKVLTNLVLNASEAVNGNGLIQVTTTHEGKTVGFAVRDNGCGMSPEFIEKSLFKPFQTTKKRGLGIGLFHCKLIVEAHHGTFEVTSAVGAGTEFRVNLPIG